MFDWFLLSISGLCFLAPRGVASLDWADVLLGTYLGQPQSVVLVRRGVNLLHQLGLLVRPHVDVLQFVPDSHLAHLKLLGAELGPEQHQVRAATQGGVNNMLLL